MMRLKRILGNDGFTLVEIIIIVVIISLLAFVAGRELIKAKHRTQEKACITNLKQIDGAKTLWALDTGAGSNDTPTWEQLASGYVKKKLSCPAGGEYTIGNVSTEPTCSVKGHKLP